MPRIAQEDIFGLQNSQKAIIGEYGGLQDAAAMSRIDTAEREREKTYMAKHSGEPNPWNEISNAVKGEPGNLRAAYLRRTHAWVQLGPDVPCSDSGASRGGEAET